MHMTHQISHHPRAHLGLLVAALGALALGGCSSAMYGGTPSDMSGSVTSQYAPGTYEPPYQVGAAGDHAEPAEAAPQWTAEQKYEYRGGRDPLTGRAKIQM